MGPESTQYQVLKTQLFYCSCEWCKSSNWITCHAFVFDTTARKFNDKCMLLDRICTLTIFAPNLCFPMIWDHTCQCSKLALALYLGATPGRFGTTSGAKKQPGSATTQSKHPTSCTTVLTLATIFSLLLFIILFHFAYHPCLLLIYVFCLVSYLFSFVKQVSEQIKQ